MPKSGGFDKNSFSSVFSALTVLSGPTMWHLRGCVRAGISVDDVESIQQAIETIAKFSGKTLDVGRVGDIKDEMHDLL